MTEPPKHDNSRFWIEYHNNGSGPHPQVGENVTINYIETMLNGTKIESTYDKK